MPNHEAVLFVISSSPPLTTGQIAVLDLNTTETKRLGLAGVSPRYASTGHLVYASADGSLRAVPFDAGSLEITGNPVPLVEGVAVKPTGAAEFGISDNGRLVYVLGEAAGGIQTSLVWVDRAGREEPIAAPPRGYRRARISPDGTRVALDILEPEDDIWVWDLAGELLTPLTLDARVYALGRWMPDGQRIVFTSNRADGGEIYWTAADGARNAERLTESATGTVVDAVTPDGTRLITRAPSPDRSQDLFVVTLDGHRATETLLSTEFNEQNAAGNRKLHTFGN